MRLNADQKSLLEALREQHASLGEMYEAGRRLVPDEQMPFRMALVGLAFRELMDKLPRHLDVPAPRKENLRERLRALDQALRQAQAESSAFDQGQWAGEIDEHLHQFLRTATESFRESEEMLQERRESGRAFLKATDVASDVYPERLEARDLRIWNQCERFFNEVAHGKGAEDEELLARVADLEQLLISRLAPRVAREYEEIDKLIAEGEG